VQVRQVLELGHLRVDRRGRSGRGLRRERRLLISDGLLIGVLLVGRSLLLRALLARVVGHGGNADDPNASTSHSHHVVVPFGAGRD
jgi:hypothetical protein